MCGIAGLLYADPDRPVEPEILAAMSRALAHRGPDGAGVHHDPGLGLVHRRLAIIDLAGGNQPMTNEDGQLWVVFNGEIYNHRTLRRRLERQGHTFRTRSDTEVLLHLYEEHGAGLVEHLRGMFAFAVWDRRVRRLLLARDRVGIKPLYLYRDRQMLLFGSELKAILTHPQVRRAVDPRAIAEYLSYGFVPGPRSILQGIEKLPPAHHLTVAQARPAVGSPQRYWRLHQQPDPRPDAAAWSEAIRAKLDETVRLHRAADVGIGVFLSGGIDSGIVLGTAAEQVDHSLQSFSIGFESGSQSELPQAQAQAQRFRTQHHTRIVRPDALSLVEQLSWYFDEPFADSSAIPTYLVSQLAAERVKLVLSGDGGDEAFGGYRRYQHDLREAQVRQHLPAWFRRAVLGPLATAWPQAPWLPRPLRAQSTLQNLSLDPAEAYARTVSLCRSPLRNRLLAPELRAQLADHDPGRVVSQAYWATGASEPLGAMTGTDLATLLPDDFLVKVDRASMAHGLEVRPPLLDHELLELAATIPTRWKVRGGRGKWILRHAGAGLLSRPVMDGPKRGFELPMDDWLRGPLRPWLQERVLAPGSPLEGWICRSTARALERRHAAGLGQHGPLLWSLLVLEQWSDRYLGNGFDRTQGPDAMVTSAATVGPGASLA